MSAPSTSFWRQDVNRYVQQQSWTRSFRQVDQNWNQELSSDSSPVLTTTTAPAGELESASVINPNAFDSQPASGWIVALQSSVSNNFNSASTAEKKSGSLLDRIA